VGDLLDKLPHDIWGVVALAILMLGLFGITWVKTNRVATKAEDASTAATLAAEHSKPTSNGFASTVTEGLAAIAAAQAATDATAAARHEENLRRFESIEKRLPPAPPARARSPRSRKDT
jgi:hypothetical protein